MEYFLNTVLTIQNKSYIDAIWNYVVIRLAVLHLDLFRTTRTCFEEHGQLNYVVIRLAVLHLDLFRTARTCFEEHGQLI